MPSKITLTQEEPITPEATALGDDHAFGAVFRDRYGRSDRVGPVQDMRRSTTRYAGQGSRVVNSVRPAVRLGLGAFQ